MFYTIYKSTNIINGKFYIGKHQTILITDSYMGSGKAIKEAINKYGKENFKKEILFVFDNESEMNEKEKELITKDFISSNTNYNLGVGGEGGAHFKGKTHSSKSKMKIRDTLKGRKRPDLIQNGNENGRYQDYKLPKHLMINLISDFRKDISIRKLSRMYGLNRNTIYGYKNNIEQLKIYCGV